jgi:hypothetical protein
MTGKRFLTRRERREQRRREVAKALSPQLYTGNPVPDAVDTVTLTPFWALQPRRLMDEWLSVKVWTRQCSGKANFWLAWHVEQGRFSRSFELRELAVRQPELVPLATVALRRKGKVWASALGGQGVAGR